jgi:hypothetical protein
MKFAAAVSLALVASASAFAPAPSASVSSCCSDRETDRLAIRGDMMMNKAAAFRMRRYLGSHTCFPSTSLDFYL